MGAAQAAVQNAVGAGCAALKGAGLGLGAGGVVAVNLYWKALGNKHDLKSVNLSENMSLHQADHDSVMSAMLCRLLYTLDGRLLKVSEKTLAYSTLEELRTKTGQPSEISETLIDWPVVTSVGELELLEFSTTLLATARAKCQTITVEKIGDWQEGDFLSILPSSIFGRTINHNEKVQIKSIDRAAKTIDLSEPLKSEHSNGTRVYKLLKYVEIHYCDQKMYVQFVQGKAELVSGKKVDVNSLIKTEFGGAIRSRRRAWFLRSMFHPGGALSPSYCSVISHDDHDAHHGKVSNTASICAGEPCKIFAYDEADPMRRVMFEDKRVQWFKKEEITQAAFTISGASGGGEAANGTWYETGTHNGKPIYENGGDCFMKWEDGLQNIGTPGQAKWVVQCGDQPLYCHEAASLAEAQIGWLQPSSASAIRLNKPEAHHGMVCNTASRCAGEPCNVFAHDEADPRRRVMFKDGRIDWFEKAEIARATFTISGAAGRAEAANGTWYETGTHNGKPMYENGRGCSMKWDDGLQNLGTPGQAKWVVQCGDQYPYYHEEASATPAQTGWLQSPSASAVRLDKKASAPAPVTLYIAWQGTMPDKRPMDIFTDLGAAPVKAGLWHKQFPDLWVHSAMYSKVQNDALGQTEMILELIRAYDVKRIVFCGHSLGGGLARIAHVVTLATFENMHEHEKSIVKNVNVQSITWAAPMVFFDPKPPEKHYVPMNDGTKRPISQEDFRWLTAIQAQLKFIKEGVAPATQNVAEDAFNLWQRFPVAEKSDHMDKLKKQLEDNSVNHIFDKDIVPQLPGNHQFFKPALKMVACSLIEQHLPIMQQALADAANDFASAAFLEGAVANNLNELENFSHMCTVKVYTPEQEVPTVVTSAKDLPTWKEEPGDSYQYLAACHSMLPNNVVGCSTLTLGTDVNAPENKIIHVESTHDWRKGDCLRICSQVEPEEEVQIEEISKTKITLKEPLRHGHSAGVMVRKEPRRIRNRDGKWGTYIGPLSLGRVRHEGIVRYDEVNGDDCVFVGVFDKDGQLSEGVQGSLSNLTKPTSTVIDGKTTDPFDTNIWAKYTERWAQFRFMHEDSKKHQADIDALKQLPKLSLPELKREASKHDVQPTDIDQRIQGVDEQRDQIHVIIELIYQKKPAALVRKVKADLAANSTGIAC